MRDATFFCAEPYEPFFQMKTWYKQHVEWRLLKSSHYRWYVFTPQISRETIAPIVGEYRFFAAGGKLMQHAADGEPQPADKEILKQHRALRHKRVVYVCDGRTLAGGLADRFKGILSLFAICQEMGYDFRIHYTSPFRLEDFLLPADHDWRISPEELHPAEAAMLVLENTDDSAYQTRKQVQWLRHRLQESPEEVHVITNSNYAYDLDYPALFRQLFRFTPDLEQALEEEVQQISGGRPYLSVSARFLSLLGDFRETGNNDALPKDQAEALLAGTLSQLQLLHVENPDYTLLVSSDSTRFLQKAGALAYTYVVQGEVAHTDLMKRQGAERAHLKLFLDFFLISRAERIYLLQGKRMRQSGFPYAASRISGHPFEVRKF